MLCNNCFFKFTLKFNKSMKNIWNLRIENLNIYPRIMKMKLEIPKLKNKQLYSFNILYFSSPLFVKKTKNIYFSNNKESQPNNEERGSNDQPSKDPDNMPNIQKLFFGFIIGLALTLYLTNLKTIQSDITWNEFVYEMLAKGEVTHINVNPDLGVAFIHLAPGAIVHGKPAGQLMFALEIPDIDVFEDKLRKAEQELNIKPQDSVPISYDRKTYYMVRLLILGLIIALLFSMKRFVKFQIPNPMDMFANERKAKFVRVDLQTMKGQGIKFSDVAGLHEAKVEVMEFVDYLKKPEIYKNLGAKIPKGALLLGPPGCGKTLLAKAVASEARVPFLAMAGSEFVEMVGGLGAARVRDLFAEARQRSPCIIYIDEIDAIGRKRSGINIAQSGEEEQTLNQLLVEMDGIGTKVGVVILASTNRAEVLDNALLRAGRFDRHILIDLPVLAERIEIFDMYLKKLKLAKPANTYSNQLAQLSPGMSGADISNICNEAALHAARLQNTSVDVTDFDYAVERVTAGVAKKSRILSRQEKAMVAYHEAGHALVGWLAKHTDVLLKVSILPRTHSALGFSMYTPRDIKLYSKDMLFDHMSFMLGGRAAESLTFNTVSSGAEDDLSKVTKLAYNQIRMYGMNERLGLLSFPVSSDGGDNFAAKPYSKNTARIIDEEARKLVAMAYKYSEKLLIENKEKLKVIAEALLEKESLNFKDMEELVGPPTKKSSI